MFNDQDNDQDTPFFSTVNSYSGPLLFGDQQEEESAFNIFNPNTNSHLPDHKQKRTVISDQELAPYDARKALDQLQEFSQEDSSVMDYYQRDILSTLVVPPGYSQESQSSRRDGKASEELQRDFQFQVSDCFDSLDDEDAELSAIKEEDSHFQGELNQCEEDQRKNETLEKESGQGERKENASLISGSELQVSGPKSKISFQSVEKRTEELSKLTNSKPGQIDAKPKGGMKFGIQPQFTNRESSRIATQKTSFFIPKITQKDLTAKPKENSGSKYSRVSSSSKAESIQSESYEKMQKSSQFSGKIDLQNDSISQKDVNKVSFQHKPVGTFNNLRINTKEKSEPKNLQVKQTPQTINKETTQQVNPEIETYGIRNEVLKKEKPKVGRFKFELKPLGKIEKSNHGPKPRESSSRIGIEKSPNSREISVKPPEKKVSFNLADDKKREMKAESKTDKETPKVEKNQSKFSIVKTEKKPEVLSVPIAIKRDSKNSETYNRNAAKIVDLYGQVAKCRILFQQQKLGIEQFYQTTTFQRQKIMKAGSETALKKAPK